MESLRGELQKKFSDFNHEKDDLYELGLNQETHELRKWDEMIPDFKYDPNVEFFDILVPTSDTVKYKTVLNILMSNGRNALIMGETGVGKSVVTKDFLYHVDEEKYVYTFINFSGKTSSKNL
jgi:dynein heavy chain